MQGRCILQGINYGMHSIWYGNLVLVYKSLWWSNGAQMLGVTDKFQVMYASYGKK